MNTRLFIALTAFVIAMMANKTTPIDGGGGKAYTDGPKGKTSHQIDGGGGKRITDGPNRLNGDGPGGR